MATLVAADFTDTIDSTKSWVQLRVFDHEGESYLTPRIPVSSDTANLGGAAFTKAFQALPNKAISSISCTSKVIDAVPDTTLEDGFYVTCQYTDNPGPHRLPEVVASAFASSGAAPTASRAYVTADIRRGESVDYCATALSNTYTSGADSTTITVSGSTVGITVPSMIKIKDQLLIVTALASASTLTNAWALPAATATAIAGGATMYTASGVTVTADVCKIIAWTVGSNSFSCATDAQVPTAVVGSKIFYQNAIYYVRAIVPAVTGTPALITVDRKFGGKSADGSDCFKGYTNDNCDTQNILAF
ncbi:hypothetical protein SDRG_07546 [Saprolegnia diclina VS20]|uniref:Uncharacterized protein n=1 Tax=Saprolegnia diclina (strain VS20) TaxID=1156394 RepID=T0RWK4_SAPDV|nr:hypothetical protein SDRG_07546 [Saprolegnia diclina VS20]EQC34732.1 hypothetical protein SDRG_07546 [Saprolegnia diclina VS20]|eukprot:XP_008611604.1 hypothetical protein SDRG_07546 [Saprolegnia diclina VS20]